MLKHYLEFREKAWGKREKKKIKKQLLEKAVFLFCIQILNLRLIKSKKNNAKNNKLGSGL